MTSPVSSRAVAAREQARANDGRFGEQHLHEGDLDVLEGSGYDSELWCYECGEPVEVTDTGVSHHVDAWGGVDHDADADHVAIPDAGVGIKPHSAFHVDPIAYEQEWDEVTGLLAAHHRERDKRPGGGWLDHGWIDELTERARRTAMRLGEAGNQRGFDNTAGMFPEHAYDRYLGGGKVEPVSVGEDLVDGFQGDFDRGWRKRELAKQWASTGFGQYAEPVARAEARRAMPAGSRVAVRFFDRGPEQDPQFRTVAKNTSHQAVFDTGDGGESSLHWEDTQWQRDERGNLIARNTNGPFAIYTPLADAIREAPAK